MEDVPVPSAGGNIETADQILQHISLGVTALSLIPPLTPVLAPVAVAMPLVSESCSLLNNVYKGKSIKMNLFNLACGFLPIATPVFDLTSRLKMRALLKLFETAPSVITAIEKGRVIYQVGFRKAKPIDYVQLTVNSTLAIKSILTIKNDIFPNKKTNGVKDSSEKTTPAEGIADDIDNTNTNSDHR